MKKKLNPAKDIVKALGLVRAAQEGDLEAVREKIAAGAEPALGGGIVPDPLWSSPDAFNACRLANMHAESEVLNAAMYWAAFYGHAEVVGFFLERGDYCQATLGMALFGAVHAGDLPLVQKLVAAGADASFHGHAALGMAFFRENADIRRFLTGLPGEGGPALAFFIRTGDFAGATDMLKKGIDVRTGIDAICNQLTDRARLVEEDARAEYLLFLETLFGFAEAAGEDMAELTSFTVASACLHWSSPVMEKLAGHPLLLAHPDRQDLLGKAVYRTGLSANRSYDVSYEGYDALAEKLLGAGASPQTLLRAAIESGALPLVRLALHHGADSRLVKKDLLEKNREPVVAAAVAADVASRTAQDRARLAKTCGKNFDAAQLRQTDGDGRTFLMLAVLSGEGREALAAFARSVAPLSAEDLLKRDPKGNSVIDMMAARGIAGLLVDPKLWTGRPAEYQAVWEELPSDVRKEMLARNEDILGLFESAAARQALKERIACKNRWKL